MNNQKEVWKDVKNYEGIYQVSSFGRVKSLARLDSINRRLKERLLNPIKDSTRYLVVGFSLNGKTKTFKVHQLVAVAFLEHAPDGHRVVVDHIDNNKLNNHIDNLQLISHRENTSKDKKGYSSKYVGVDWVKQRRKWLSRIYINGKQIYLGHFTDELEASEMYQKALSNLDKYNGNNKEFRTLLNSIV